LLFKQSRKVVLSSIYHCLSNFNEKFSSKLIKAKNFVSDAFLLDESEMSGKEWVLHFLICRSNKMRNAQALSVVYCYEED